MQIMIITWNGISADIYLSTISGVAILKYCFKVINICDKLRFWNSM